MSSQDGRRVVAILGAGGALGSALSASFAAEASTDLVLGDLSELALKAALDQLPADRGAVETAVVDVSRADQVQAVVDLAKTRFGRVDAVISNAGVLAPSGRIHNLTDADWQQAFSVNVMGAVNAIRASVPAMREQGGGSIVLTASVAGMTAWSHAAPYCATKAAVIQVAKVAAIEYAKDKIRVNCVCPGTFLTVIHEGLSQEAIGAMAAKHPLGLGAPADLVAAYSYLVSDASRWTTGSSLVVDGGYSAP